MNKIKSITILSFSLFFLISLSVNAYSQGDIQTTFIKSGNIITIKAKTPTAYSGNFEAFQCFIRYLNTDIPVLTVTSSAYPLSPIVLENTTTDPYDSQYNIAKFSFNNTLGPWDNINWNVSGTEYNIFSFSITGGLGTNPISLVSDINQINIRIKYIIGSGNDFTNYTTPFIAGSDNLTISNNGNWELATLNIILGKYWKTNTGSTSLTTGSNWSDGIPPISTDDVAILAGVNQPIAGAGSVCNKLKIETGANVQIAYDGDLTVNGDLDIADDNSLIVISTSSGTGSLITNGTVPSGNKAKIERFISAYTTSYNGWHFISSPVKNADLGNFAPGTGDDFFSYNETLYLCWQYQSSGSFINGKGYLAAYLVSATKSFSGSLNKTNIAFTNLSLTPSQQNGYHLLGNPFSSSITWNVGSWGLSNVNSFAYVLNSGGSYTTLSSGGIIPAMQGFFVQVSNANNAITIPADARTHSAVNLLNKSTETERLFIKASSVGNSTYVESIIHTNNNATNGYDSDLDANFLAGLNGVPQLYTQLSNNKVSINTVPTIGSNVVSIPMGFVAGDATNYQLTADGINTFNCSIITLQDLKTNTTQNLVSNPVYNFTSTSGDNVNRFIIHFNSTVGVGEVNKVSGSIYSYGNDIYVNSSETVKQICIYNTIGQLIYTVNNPKGLFKYSLTGNSTDYYIVKVITDKNVNSEKVFVK